MKRIFTAFATVLITGVILAQNPEAISYQSVIRDSDDQLATNLNIGMQISILQGVDAGSASAVYEERHFPTTNANGLVILEIGSGTIISGDFASIDWANGNYFIKTETDLNGGSNYTISGTSQLLSVPYALFAKEAESIAETANAIHSFEFPQGINGEYLNIELTSPEMSYTVPLGFNLYITTSGNFPLVNNVLYGIDGRGLIFPENTTIVYDISYGLPVYTGFLMPTSNQITPVYFKLDDMDSSYTVPAGKKLVLKSGTGQGSPLCVNSTAYHNQEGGIWLFPSGVTISNCNASTFSPFGFGYTGYLLDE